MKRKWLAIALAMSVIMSMAGCGSQNTETTAAGTKEEETTAGMTVMDLPEYVASEYVKLDKYTGVEVEVPNKTVTDKEFEEAIQMLLEEYGENEQITDRVTAEGDTIIFDYSGAIDGVAFAGGTATKQETTLGQGGWIDGFEEGLIGATVGEEFVVDCKFPDPYQNNPDLAGKTAQFTLKVHYIVGELIVPELTDDFVKGLEGYTVSTVAEFKDVYYKELSQQKAAYVDDIAKNEVFSTLLVEAEFTGFPKDYVETYTMDMMNSYAYSASMYGMTLEDFASMYQMTMDEFEAEVQMMAEQQIKVEILYQYIAEKEAMEVTEDEYMAIVQGYMEYYGYTDMTSFVNDYGVENVEKQGHADALLEKVMQFCYDNAVKTEAPLETEAPETTAPAVG